MPYSQEKLYQWILRQQEAGARVGIVDILNYLQVIPSLTLLQKYLKNYFHFGDYSIRAKQVL